MATDYNPRKLAKEIKTFFEKDTKAGEVLVYIGKKALPILRKDALDKNFITDFLSEYKKR